PKKAQTRYDAEAYPVNRWLILTLMGGQVIFHLHAHLISGTDMGGKFIKIAVKLAILWRKLISILKSNH
ncbi:MAG: hypothetical protein ACP5VS_02630, partial [Desulfomonilaceae bacterium]